MLSIPLHFLFVCLFFVPDSMDFMIAEMSSTDKNWQNENLKKIKLTSRLLILAPSTQVSFHFIVTHAFDTSVQRLGLVYLVT